uniref:Transposase-associated domain-containing protein n=1 Tax=Tanacetum cinerariifolium TaxID=118510 RepID=A0A6L2KHG1_TANCI|nr:hypothetical protein [Tanacetum cinerariifolium]
MLIDDKSWILLERDERAFYIKFIDHCKPKVDSAGKIRCPCKSCQTILWVSIKQLLDHIMRHGFDLGYKIWLHHGEPDLPLPPPVIDNPRQPQMSDMTALLNDLSYILRIMNTMSQLKEILNLDFTKEPRNVRLGLAADGFNPFGNLSQAYNMWLVILTTYNLPPWLCMKESSFMLTLLIPGPKSLGKDIDVYLRPLIKDLKTPPRQDKTWKGCAFKVACGLANGKCLKPQAAYSFTPKNRKKFSKPEGLITEGYVAEEALTFSSHYFRDVTMKINRPDRNADPLPQRVSFMCSNSLFPNQDMKEEFPDWFGSQGVIVVEDDPDIIHFGNLSNLPLSTSLNDLDNATFHIDGQSTEVDAPPDIINVVDEDDDIIDDDGVDKMLADVARSYGDDSGGENRPPPHYVPTNYGGCFPNRGKGKRKPNLGGRAAGKLNTRDKTRNLSLKEITNTKGPIPIRFEVRDKQALMPLGEHAAHWSGYIREVIRGVPLYHPSWLKVSKEKKEALIADIRRRSGGHVLKRLRRKSGISIFSFGKIPGTLPEPFKIGKTVQRARSYLNRDPRGDDEATGTYTNDEINRLAKGGKQRGHILGVGRFESGGASESGRCGADEESTDDQDEKDEDGDGDS